MKHCLYLLVLSVFYCASVMGQCRQFAVSKKKTLEDFIHDGAYTSISMKPAQNVQFTKTFFKGQRYRLVLDGAPELMKTELRVFDLNQNLVYSNVEEGVSKKWDFVVESTRNLIIMVSIPRSANMNASGCVSALIGFKSTEDYLNQLKH